LEAIMAIKFEWQFKYRDEGSVNAQGRAQDPEMQKVRNWRHFGEVVGFDLPSRFSDK